MVVLGYSIVPEVTQNLCTIWLVVVSSESLVLVLEIPTPASTRVISSTLTPANGSLAASTSVATCSHLLCESARAGIWKRPGRATSRNGNDLWKDIAQGWSFKACDCLYVRSSPMHCHGVCISRRCSSRSPVSTSAVSLLKLVLLFLPISELGA